jgi:nitrile hydratase subunit beta
MSFAVGDAVVVSDRVHPGHHRTPRYLKGRRGTVAREHGAFPDPETRAYGGDGSPLRTLYLVAFPASESTDGAQIYADVFEHWLEPTS